MHIHIVLAVIVWLVLPTPAMAYIDPGSGSAIMSAIIGALVAVGLAIKSYWYKLRGLLFGKRRDSDRGNR